MKRASLGDLKPDPHNARKHNPKNVGMIEKSIQRNGFGRSLLLANDGTIIAGNATADAAGSVGLEDVIIVPSDGTKVIAVQRTDIDPDSDAFHELGLDDNRAAELAEWDGRALAWLRDERKIDLTARFTDGLLARILNEPSAAMSYSRTVLSPVYEVTGEKPDVGDLVDTTTYDTLIAEIEATHSRGEIDDDTAQFLWFAAHRHLVFDYAKIAEFYAHADPVVQNLMERSALVILDIDRAIEEGFARLVGELRELRAASDAMAESDDDDD